MISSLILLLLVESIAIFQESKQESITLTHTHHTHTSSFGIIDPISRFSDHVSRDGKKSEAVVLLEDTRFVTSSLLRHPSYITPLTSSSHRYYVTPHCVSLIPTLCHSTNGTFVNNDLVGKSKTKVLYNGCDISLLPKRNNNGMTCV